MLEIYSLGAKWEFAEVVLGLIGNILLCLILTTLLEIFWCLLWARPCAGCWGYGSEQADTVPDRLKAGFLVGKTDNT